MHDFEESDFQDSMPSEKQVESWCNQALQERRAREVFKELTEGLPDLPASFDDADMSKSQIEFDAHIKKLNQLIAQNLDSNSIWEFVFLAGDLRDRIRQVEFAETKVKQASNGKRLTGATSRAKIAREEREKLNAERSAMLAAAGMQGAQSRNRPFEAVKKWAREEAKVMRGAHKDVARKLANKLPSHLANASKDPVRLIYDALRAPAKQD